MNKTEIIDDIKRKIFNENYQPGTYLIERDLCDHYGISRTPMREILFTLMSKGLLTQQRGKGFSVRTMDFKQLFEAFEAREGIEGLAARLCCRKVTWEERAKLEELLASLKTLDVKNNSEEGIRLGRQLHHIVMVAARNSMIADFYERIESVAGLTSNMTKRIPNIEMDSRIYHMYIIESILAGDEDGSELRMREHIGMTCRHLLQNLYPGSSEHPDGDGRRAKAPAEQRT